MKQNIIAFLLASIFATGCSKSYTFQDASAVYNNGNYSKAFKLLQPIAEKGDPDAQNNLGAMYANGEGVTKDYQQAEKWYRLSANQGNSSAQNNLGWMYYKGQGVNQDYLEATRLFRLSADKGHPKAQLNLGAMYSRGEGVTKNYQEAVKWFRLSAEQGDSEAQYNLGAMYNNGDGVSQDYQEALKWFKLSAKQGYQNAIAALNNKDNIGLREAQGLAKADALDAKEMKSKAEALAKEFPYEAVITCKIYGNNTSIDYCLRQSDYYSRNTQLEIQNGDNYGMYQYWDISRIGSQQHDGFHIQLGNKFALSIQNSNELATLNLKIKNIKNDNIIFNKSAAQYGEILFRLD